MRLRGDRIAFGAPGIDPRWQHGDKIGVGTAYSSDSRLWYTLWRGIVTEVYYPYIDHPQLRDLQFLITDGERFFHEERRDLRPDVQLLAPTAPGYSVRSTDPEGRYTLDKEVLSDPHLPVLLVRLALRRAVAYHDPLRLYVLAAPHLGGGGAHNNAYVAEVGGRSILAAEHDGTWLALGASVPFVRLSTGYVGSSDGWTDVAGHRRMTWEFDRAPDGNVALTAELPPEAEAGVTVALSFGDGPTNVTTALLQSLGEPYDRLRARFLEQWARAAPGATAIAAATADDGRLFRVSHTMLHVHEDKSYPGAFIAALTIPWGNARNDGDRGGYHLVWTRDLCQIATGLLASGDATAALRALIYLAAIQRPDGSFPQNSWLDGEPYWGGLQLDEVSFPILLADRLRRFGDLGAYDPYPMIRSGARFLLEHGPVTGQERWEEASGYSPSTLAVNLSALVVAASFARERGDPASARYLEQQAAYVDRHLESWTVTDRGVLRPDRPRHYLRILPARPGDSAPAEDPDAAVLTLANQPPGAPATFPARAIVDAGFLELVRYGVRPAEDPVVRASVDVIDSVLRVETPYGPCWRRYPHDGYGQRDDGGPYAGWGVGRAWPLLTGERGHYELARGGDARSYLRALERFATPTGLLSEQLWDRPSDPKIHLELGRPTGAAMPLMWAHAEYLKLLRSVHDGRVFDRVPAVERFRATAPSLGGVPDEVWKAARPIRSFRRGGRLRVQAPDPFRLHWSLDGWSSVRDDDATTVPLGLSYVDLEVDPKAPGPLVFTFYWTAPGRWDGRDQRVELVAAGPPSGGARGGK
jgi:glucoamylase